MVQVVRIGLRLKKNIVRVVKGLRDKNE